MSTIVSRVVLMVGDPIEAPDRIGQKWVDGLKTNAARIYENLLGRIPDAIKYQERIAEPSNREFNRLIDPGFVSRRSLSKSDIVTKHGKNIREGYQKFVRNLGYIFETIDGETAKRFKDKVERSKTNLLEELARRVILFGGIKREGRGPAVIAAGWLTNDHRILDWLRQGDRVEIGTAFQITRDQDRSALKAALVERLIQAGVALVRSEFSPTVLTEQNTWTNRIVQGFVDPALGVDPFTSGGLSHLDYIIQGNKLFLEVQVSRV